MFIVSNGSLVLNEATMKAAIEHWLNTVVLKEPCEVARVKAQMSSGSPTFTIDLLPREGKEHADSVE